MRSEKASIVSRSISGRLVIGFLSILLLSITTQTAISADKIRWKMHSAFGTNLAVIGRTAPYLAETIETISGGEFEIKVFEPGALTGGFTYFNPISQGAFDAAYGTPGVSAGKNSVFAFATTWPFGPGPGEFLAWYRYGGGNELVSELYERDNIKFLLCGIIPPETSGWFRDPIDSLEQLKGLKMRFFGIGAKVMQKFGVSTQLIAAADIYPALELGTIDATEFSMPAIDRSLGLHQIAKYNYFPGWHQPSSILEVLVNMEKWNALPVRYQVMLETACDANTAIMLADGEASQYDAMMANEKDGVSNRIWPDEILDSFKAAWEEVLEEERAANADVDKLWRSFSAFHEKYQIWGERGYLK